MVPPPRPKAEVPRLCVEACRTPGGAKAEFRVEKDMPSLQHPHGYVAWTLVLDHEI